MAPPPGRHDSEVHFNRPHSWPCVNSNRMAANVIRFDHCPWKRGQVGCSKPQHRPIFDKIWRKPFYSALFKQPDSRLTMLNAFIFIYMNKINRTQKFSQLSLILHRLLPLSKVQECHVQIMPHLFVHSFKKTRCQVSLCELALIENGSCPVTVMV